MCGIVGYIGGRQAQQILLGCLAKLEYRGYDSCGIALDDGSIRVYKDAVRVSELAKALPRLGGTVGVGHTRWATHGEPSQANAHPHCDCTGRVAVVHNGIINNYQGLRRQLASEGHQFASDTDTEVLSHLVEKYYQGDLEAAVTAALHDIHGSYALIVLVVGEPKMVIARRGSPLIVGVGDGEYFVASDVPTILDYTTRVMYLDDGDIGVVGRDGVKVKRGDLEVALKEQKVLWTAEQAQKSGYEHFMLKEIHEQPKVIRETIVGWVPVTEPVVDFAGLKQAGAGPVLILGCGTSYHAALVGKYVVEELVDLPVMVELASEFNYRSCPSVGGGAIAITQSGETADVLIAMRRLGEMRCPVLAITNVVGSTASRIAGQTIYTRAGPEISVAATKSFIAQVMVLYWLAMSGATAGSARLTKLLLELRKLPSKVQQVLDSEDSVVEHAVYLSRYERMFFIGRGINYPVAMEGALKMKEIAYVCTEGYAAGELKHGPFALLGDDTPVVAIVARDKTYEAMLANMREIKSRGSPVIALAEEGDGAVAEVADFVIDMPVVDEMFTPVVNTVALQLLAYYAAKNRGCSVDFPRNLAKSVTVE